MAAECAAEGGDARVSRFLHGLSYNRCMSSLQPQTLIEKLATAHAVGLKPGQQVFAGDFITIRPRHIMTHDNTSAVMSKFKEIFKGVSGGPGVSPGSGPGTGGTPVPPAARIHDPRQPVFAIDHDIQNVTPENLGKYAKIEAFAREHGVDFYPAGTGISHQVMVQEGYVTPGSMVVGSDSHSNLYGAMCCLGTPVVRTDAASIWATGVTWWQVPPVARCVLRGRLQPGVVGKDVIIALCGLFNNDEVLNMAVEFVAPHGEGDALRCLSMDQRMSISNMTTEWGALVGLFPFDEVLRNYLLARADYLRKKGTPRITHADVEKWWGTRSQWSADAGAHYAVELELDVSGVIPHVSGPDDVKTMTSLPEIEAKQVKIQKAYLLSCVNARLEDLREAAYVVDGSKVAPGVEFYVAAASAEVQKAAEADGTWATLMSAGAIPLPSGCGPCIGLGIGTLKAGEVGISATNRNFKGRMGDRDAKAYLASPAVVAASAMAGFMCAPPQTKFAQRKATFRVKVNEPAGRVAASGNVDVIPGFPSEVRSRILWLPIDNLNTDGIYSGKLTYRDDVPPEEMAAASFNNYDPNFVNIARKGDVVVSGRNFGTGSSREQAATCLQHFGIPCVIAHSFSETYKRNAFNNGFVVFECPELVAWMTEKFGAKPHAATVVGPEVVIDYRRSIITCDGRQFAFPPLSVVAQELVVAGGAENVVKQRLAAAANA
jgi:homoaconitate hydratase